MLLAPDVGIQVLVQKSLLAFEVGLKYYQHLERLVRNQRDVGLVHRNQLQRVHELALHNQLHNSRSMMSHPTPRNDPLVTHQHYACTDAPPFAATRRLRYSLLPPLAEPPRCARARASPMPQRKAGVPENAGTM